MSYTYEKYRANVFTEDGQKTFLHIRDRAKHLLREAGAVRVSEAIKGASGDSWTMLACIDRMVELGELVELPRDCWGQHRVFINPKSE
jgi:hypothetical protein